MAFADLKAFHAGLEGVIGPPGAKVRAEIENEHTLAADSDLFYTSSNYVVKTTPRIEWWYVVEPTPQRLAGLSRSNKAYRDLTKWPEEDNLHGAAPRKPRPLDELNLSIKDKNAQLKEVRPCSLPPTSIPPLPTRGMSSPD